MKNVIENTTNTNDLVGLFFRDEDIVFRIASVNRGWVTSVSEDGVEQKDRVAALAEYEQVDGYDSEQDDDEESEGKPTMASQLKKYRARYTVGIAPSGRKSLNNGDPVARALEAAPLEYLYETVHELFGLDLHTKYERLNLGAQRMNLGNRIRSAYKKEDHKKHDVVVQWVEKQLDEIERPTQLENGAQ